MPKEEADQDGRRPPGPVSIKMDLRRKRTPSQDRRAARALMKMGLGLVYAKDGAERALHPRYDLTRAAILGQPYEGWFLTRPFGRHQDKLDLTVEITEAIPGIDEAVLIKYGQFQMATGMRPGAFPEAAGQWCVDNGWEVHPIASVRDGKAREPYIRLGRNWKNMVDAQSVSVSLAANP